jgi:hypothetical protein
MTRASEEGGDQYLFFLSIVDAEHAGQRCAADGALFGRRYNGISTIDTHADVAARYADRVLMLHEKRRVGQIETLENGCMK